MESKPGIIHRLVTGSWTFVDQSRRAVVNILFLLIIYFIINAIFFSDETPSVNANSLLVVKPVGFIVDELDYVKPLDEAIDEMRETTSIPPQTLLRDLLRAINLAAKDDDVSAMLLDLGSMFGAEPSKLQEVAESIRMFKASGKTVYAYAESYSQSQYFLAAQADEVMMDPMGMLFIEGYGRYNTYFKSAIEKLGITTHIFKVGTYKSAIEPYTRDNMSEAAREANLGYLGDLWQAYKQGVSEARNLSIEQIQAYSDNFLAEMSTNTNETSELAVQKSLVDNLVTREQLKQYLIDEEGGNMKGDNYRELNYSRYLNIVDPEPILPDTTKDKVAVVVAKGVILNGKQKAGTIGGQSTSELIRRARKDSRVKALVLRVDSPGGSAYASEIIRREIVATQAAGKPVVVSMGSYAASGGYWISAQADEIWASPTTITGSIGIFGMLATFEGPMNKFGIYRDGVGTTKLNGAFDVGKKLRDDVSSAIQNNIENGYKRFLKIVADGRDMSITEVDAVAQGRVWSGQDALELGLVDHLGDLEQAIASAATKAGMVNYQVSYIKQELSPSEQFLKDIFNTQLVKSVITSEHLSGQVPMRSASDIIWYQIQDSIESLRMLDDPNNMYAHCLCTIN